MPEQESRFLALWYQHKHVAQAFGWSFVSQTDHIQDTVGFLAVRDVVGVRQTGLQGSVGIIIRRSLDDIHGMSGVLGIQHRHHVGELSFVDRYPLDVELGFGLGEPQTSFIRPEGWQFDRNC